MAAALLVYPCSCPREIRYRNAGLSSRCSSARFPLPITAQYKPPNIMIFGAPASGKGTQCELIKGKYGLVHISAGDLLRAEVAAETEFGKQAKEYMEQGKLVPNEVVVTMIKERLGLPDVKESGWLLDGYPRSLEQAQVLETLNIRPDLFIVLEVPEDVLIERVIGRRLDPVTGKIYHLKYSPPESLEIAARLIQRNDDTEEKARTRLQTYNENLGSVLSVYEDVVKQVDGNLPKNLVFAQITGLVDVFTKDIAAKDGKASHAKRDNWRGVPTKMNTTPHSKEIRDYFYNDVCEAVVNAVRDGLHKLKVEILIPELNPEMDVYRGATLLELLRVLAFAFADDGKRVKVCVQGSMGEGIYCGLPLQLSGARQMLEWMDWGEYSTFVSIGAIGSKEVTETDDMFILMAPQNSVGSCIIDDLRAMVEAAGDRPVIVVNPRLQDVPGAAGKMRAMGRQERMEFADSFYVCYNFRLLFESGRHHPIMGAMRKRYPEGYEVYRRVDADGKEKYVEISKFPEKPTSSQVQLAFSGKTKSTKPRGIWSFLSFFD